MSWSEIKYALNSTVGTENFKPLDQIFQEALYPDREEISVSLDFSDGDQEVFPSSGKVISKATILKPDGLIPENIVVGNSIAGVVGSYSAAEITFQLGDEVSKYLETGFDSFCVEDANSDISVSYDSQTGLTWFWATQSGMARLFFFNKETLDPSNPETFKFYTVNVLE